MKIKGIDINGISHTVELTPYMQKIISTMFKENSYMTKISIYNYKRTKATLKGIKGVLRFDEIIQMKNLGLLKGVSEKSLGLPEWVVDAWKKHLNGITKKPCAECPFKINSLKSYLGEASNDPEGFLASMEHHPIPCHMAVDWEIAEENEIKNACWENTCIGSMQFLKNTFKLPKEIEYKNLLSNYEKNENVFQKRSEFINHHKKEN